MTFEYTIKQPADIVFDNLTSAGKQSNAISGSLQLQQRTERLSGRFKIFFIPCSFTYLATIIPEPSKHRISMQAKIFRILEIKRVYQLKAAGNVTRVRENVFVKGNSFMKRMARESLSGTDIQFYTGMEKVGNYV